MFNFIKEYNKWKKEHKEEVNNAKLRKELIKTPLNYNLLAQLMKSFKESSVGDSNFKMEIKTKDATITFYYDNEEVRRLTTTQSILLNNSEGVTL